MYSVSADFLTAIKSNTRDISWSGTITETSGTVLSFADDNLVNGSVTRSISSQSLSIGTAYASTLSLTLILPSVSRYELYGATVTLNCSVAGATDVVPLGIYVVSEATQTADEIQIKAYDYMTKFDGVSFNPDVNTNTMLPYMWLDNICSKCGVSLGNTSAEVYAMPNGNRTTGFASVVTDVKNYRDLLGYLSAYLCGYAYIGRDGKLYIGQYVSTSDDTIPASFRYSSELSDYRTTYSGLYATYKDEAIQEYKSNTNSNGLVIDLGANPFLQIPNDTNRNDALQAIIDVFDGLYYVPYSANMPLVPIYDVGDILTFTDNQAGAYDYGAITEITYNIDGTMSVKCSGENPLLADAQDRFSKSVEGLNSNYGLSSGDKEFWLIFTSNDVPIEVGDEEVEIAELEYEQKTYTQNVEMIVVIDAQLSATADVDIRVIVDDDEDLEISVSEEHSMKGTRMFHCSNPRKITGQGLHTAKVYMTVTDSPTLWSDLV